MSLVLALPSGSSEICPYYRGEKPTVAHYSYNWIIVVSNDLNRFYRAYHSIVSVYQAVILG